MIDSIGFTLFERAMAADPLARPPRRTPRFGAREWLAALAPREPLAFFDSCFRLRPNAGGGDCLFHALAGTDLGLDRIREARRAIAAVRMRMAAAPRANARRVIAALLQTPETRAYGVDLADRGLSLVSNGTIAALQSVAGMHAGEAEIGQWCAAHGTGVLVADANGRLSRVDGRGARRLRADPDAGKALVERALRRRQIVLFKTPGHWRRIDAVAGSA
jgi:hypothetical protein